MTESRPVPQFYNQSLLTKKKTKQLTPYNKKLLPPRPCKSISPKPTFYNRFSNGSNASFKAQAVSFKTNNDISILSKHYNENCDELYFQQCFDVCSTLGSGFFGDVFKVKSKEDNKFYAVKKSRERFKGKADRKQKLQEVAKHEHLPEHPNLVKFYKAWEERQRLYIQTELCECSLSMFADSNHDIPEKIIWNYLVDLLMAVQHLHAHNLVHLDIKPENIFISKDGLYKLGDFGLVIDLTKGDVTDPIEGDPKYLAKETMQGIFTQAADIFSLGITTLELACDLDLPSGGKHWHELRNGQIPEFCFKKLSPELKFIIKKMMHPNYKERPTATELLNLPIIQKYRKKRLFIIKTKIFFKDTANNIVRAFVFLLKFLFIIQVFNMLKNCFFKKKEDTSDNKTSSLNNSLSSNSLIQNNNVIHRFMLKDNYSDDESLTLDQSILSNHPNNSIYTQPVNSHYQVQDSTINSSAGLGNISINKNITDITPPSSSFNHYFSDNIELHSTSRRPFGVRNYSNDSLNSTHGVQTPLTRRSMFLPTDESPVSNYFNSSFNQSTSHRLSFSDISDDDDDYIHNSSKLANNLIHNQTIGQKNLLKMFETADDD